MLHENALTKLARSAKRMRVMSLALMGLLPVFLAVYWSSPMVFKEAGVSLSSFVEPGLPFYSRAFGFLISCIPAGVIFFALRELRRLSILYERGVVFSESNVKCYRNLGWALIAWVGAQFITTPMLSILLTLHHPPGHRILALTLGPLDFTAICAGAVVLTISWAMARGRELEQENSSFV